MYYVVLLPFSLYFKSGTKYKTYLKVKSFSLVLVELISDT